MFSRFRCFPFLLVLAAALVSTPVRAGEPFRFTEGKHGKGELKYVQGVPVLLVEGTPEEIGEQVAVLTKSASRLLNYPREVIAAFVTPAGATMLWPRFVQKGSRLLENFPPAYRAEFETMVKTSGFDRELMMIGNTAFDLKEELNHLFNCSALVVEAERSKTGQPLFGRNMDHFPLGYLHEYSLVTVYRPRGKHAFAAVGYAGMIGCISAINDAGLSLAVLETTGAPESEGPVFRIDGVPFALNYRRLMEECTTIDEALTALRKMKRTTTNNLTVCDRHGAAVFEITPTRVVVRRCAKGIGVCTNHFCSDELKLAKPKNIFTTLDRFAIIDKARTAETKLGVDEVQKYLDAANQGKNTLQTMIFEPATLTLHVAFAVGEKPSSAQKLKRLELAPWFKNGSR
jgi:predicted choloylglycine hydrolase